MTAAKRAKELGAKNLQQVCDEFGCTRQNLSHMLKANPHKFEIVVLGVVSKLKPKEKK